MSDWELVDLRDARVDGLVRLWNGVLAWGELEGRPFAAEVSPHGIPVAYDIPGEGPVRSAMHCERVELVVGSPPVHLSALGEGVDTEWEIADWTVVEDPAALWLACGDEDPMYVAARADGRLVPVDPGVGIGGPANGPAVHHPTTARLIVAGGEIGIRIASGAERWSSTQVEEGWFRIHLTPEPDDITDLSDSWAPVTAGHRGGRPLLWDDSGRPLSSPDVALDPLWPVVLVAAGEPLVTLALQAVDGPALFSSGIDGWTRQELPGGRLVTARSACDQLWLVLDGRLWMHGDD